MVVRFDMSQVTALAADIDQATARVDDQVHDALDRAAAMLERDAKILAPVDTGRLRSSIGTDSAGHTRTVGSTVHYGGYVEFGTSKMSPRPHLMPAADRHTGTLAHLMADIETGI